jgi:hypothetical protein
VAASGITTIAVQARRRKKTKSVRPPMRPIDFTSPVEPTATTRSEATSGITVMRIAFTQSVPNGAMKSAARMSGTIPEALIAMPPATAAPRATRTRVLSVKFPSHGWRSQQHGLTSDGWRERVAASKRL